MVATKDLDVDLRVAAVEVHVAPDKWEGFLNTLREVAPTIHSQVAGILPERRHSPPDGPDEEPVAVAYRFTVYGPQIDELRYAVASDALAELRPERVIGEPEDG